MSRSFKKNPVISLTVSGKKAGHQKSWKKSCNRRFRQADIEDDIPQGNKYRRISGNI